jgi:cysteine-rich repeat protein
MASPIWINRNNAVLSKVLGVALLLNIGCAENKDSSGEDDTVNSDTEATNPDDTATVDSAEPEMEIGECGDGIVNSPTEECDDGTDNANVADACRTDCLLPKCGDGIVDDDEDCDDSNLWNIDGCDEDCTVEVGEFELEPNNSNLTAHLLGNAGSLRGMLWEQDTDCYTFSFEENDYIELTINPEQEECSHLMMIHVLEDGIDVDSDLPSDDTCPKIEPINDPSARYLPDTTETEITYCLEGIFGSAVEEYSIEWEVFSNSCTLTAPLLTETEDVDGDTFANNCDDDDDGDAILDINDNCPLHSNNGDVEFAPNADGFFETWVLTSGHTVTALQTGNCQTVDGIYEIAETSIVPSLLNTLVNYNEDPVSWAFYESSDLHIDFNVIPGLMELLPARNVFAGIWAYSDISRTIDVQFGPDDAGRVWVNGSFVGETQVCQGAGVDRYTFPSTLNAGWNYILTQVHDNGGGWGMYFRLTENGTPITDLILSPVHTGIFQDFQSDLDGDGIGDRCELAGN